MKKLDLLKEIDKAKASGILIIVEGKKDKYALEELGFENMIILHGKPLYAKIEEISSKVKECIILTDFDDKGKQFYFLLKKALVRNGVRIVERLRLAILKAKVSHIEGLSNFIKNNLS